MLGDQSFELADHGKAAVASDLGFRECGVRDDLVLDQCRRQRVDELEVAQVVEHRLRAIRPAHVRRCLLACSNWPAAAACTPAFFCGDEPADVAVGVA